LFGGGRDHPTPGSSFQKRAQGSLVETRKGAGGPSTVFSGKTPGDNSRGGGIGPNFVSEKKTGWRDRGKGTATKGGACSKRTTASRSKGFKKKGYSQPLRRERRVRGLQLLAVPRFPKTSKNKEEGTETGAAKGFEGKKLNPEEKGP